MNLQLFGQRLTSIRNELGLTQESMAKRLGVSKRSYCAYEAGETSPSAKLLTSLADIGCNINYVLTGSNTLQITEPPPVYVTHLKPDEEALLDNYRHLSKEEQRILKATSAAFAQQREAGKKAG